MFVQQLDVCVSSNHWTDLDSTEEIACAKSGFENEVPKMN